MSLEQRQRLARQQGALLRSLQGRGEPPEGFDPERIREASASLARKRARSASRACPRLADALDGAYEDDFASYAASRPLPKLGGPTADGRAFARWVARSRRLPDPARLEALGIDLRHATRPEGLVPRRRPALSWLLLRDARRLVMAASWPGRPVRSIAIPLGPRRRSSSETRVVP